MKIEKGQTYNTRVNGKLVIQQYLSHTEVYICFIETGYKTVTTSHAIRRGTVKDLLRPSVHGVGFLGVGRFKRTDNRKVTKQYTTWQSMLGRCYDRKYQEKYETYVGCTVCDEWHNFQNFAEWYDINHPNDGNNYHLDKDIKVSGNSIYSPDACCFVSPSVNLQHKSNMAAYELISPCGKMFNTNNITGFCRDNGLNRQNMIAVANGKRRHHKNWTAKKIAAIQF